MAGTTAEMDLSQFAAYASAIGRDLSSLDYTPALKQSRNAVVADVNKNFRGGHDPDGNPWPGLAHERPGAKKAGKVLRDKGLLMASIVSAGGNGHVESLTPSTLIFGTNLEYAAIHQHGGTITPKRAKMLSIPLTKDAARAGNASDFPRPLFIIEANGKVFLAERKVKKKKNKKGAEELILHYVLSAGVAIPRRPFLGIGAKLADKIGVIFRNFIIKKLGGNPNPGPGA